MQRVVANVGAGPDREHRVARQHTAATEQPTGLPVGQAELGLVEGELAVDPAREPVTDERRIDDVVEALLRPIVTADQ